MQYVYFYFLHFFLFLQVIGHLCMRLNTRSVDKEIVVIVDGFVLLCRLSDIGIMLIIKKQLTIRTVVYKC